MADDVRPDDRTTTHAAMRAAVWCGAVARDINFQLNKPAMCTLPPGIHMVHIDRRGQYDVAFTHDQVIEREAAP